MANSWFRMYGEFASDPKVQILTEALQRRYVMLLCLHCNNNLKNTPDDEIAFALRVTRDIWEETKKEFLKRKLINNDNTPHGWKNRQYISDIKDPTAAARQKRYREKRNATVTSRPPEQIQIQNRTDTEISSLRSETRAQENFSLQSEPDKPTPKKGTRLPPDWELSDQDGEWAQEEFHLSVDEIILEAEKFKDYWHARAGPGGVKLDWSATWRNWIRKVMEGKNNGFQGQKKFG